MNTKAFLLLNLLFICWGTVYSKQRNQSGIWNAGGTPLILVYPEDSVSSYQVKIDSLKIYTQIYTGFVVSHSRYYMRNQSVLPLMIRLGHPKDGIYNSGEFPKNSIHLDSLSKIKIAFDSVIQKSSTTTLTEFINNYQSLTSDWEYWTLQFESLESHVLDVYSITNSNDAVVLDNKNCTELECNSWIYSMQSESKWSKPLGKVSLIIEMKNDLNLKSVHGISVPFPIYTDTLSHYIIGQCKLLTSEVISNIIITYGNPTRNNQYGEALQNANQYFQYLNTLPSIDFNVSSKREISNKAGAYSVPNNFKNHFSYFLTYLEIYFPFILLLIVIMLVLIYLRKGKPNKQTK